MSVFRQSHEISVLVLSWYVYSNKIQHIHLFCSLFPSLSLSMAFSEYRCLTLEVYLRLF